MVITVSSKGQISIPASLRTKLGLQAGSKLEVQEKDGQIVLRPLSIDPIEEACGSLAGEPSLVDLLLEDRRKEKEREERRFG